MPRTAVKGQVLADLVAEFVEPTLEGREESGSLNADEKLISTVSQHEHNWWKAHIDGAANQRGLGVGARFGLSRRDNHRKVVKARILSHE